MASGHGSKMDALIGVIMLTMAIKSISVSYRKHSVVFPVDG
jgi:hypothetical protein